MAIDTREKRQSVVGLNRVSGPSVTPNPLKDQEWRQEVGYSYSGILAWTGMPPSFNVVWALNSNNLFAGSFTNV